MSADQLLIAVNRRVRFMLDADAAPGLLHAPVAAVRQARPDPRPHVVAPRRRDVMHVEIAMQAMPADVVHLVEGNLRQVVGVRSIAQIRPEADASGGLNRSDDQRICPYRAACKSRGWHAGS